MTRLPLLVLGALAAGCSSVEEIAAPTAGGAFADAAWSARGPAPEAPAWDIDPICLELARAAYAAHAQARRVALENIANVNTPGYKRRVVCTTADVTRTDDGHAHAVPVVSKVDSVFTSGTLELSDRALDVAIDGEGFFSVIMDDGVTGYTRDGRLHLDAEGKLVDTAGRTLTPEIAVPSDLLEISFSPTGMVSGRTAGTPDTSTMFGQVNLHRFVNASGMRRESRYWLPTDASGNPTTGTPGNAGLGTLRQGFLERSNVQLQQELLTLQALERQHRAIASVLDRFGIEAP